MSDEPQGEAPQQLTPEMQEAPPEMAAAPLRLRFYAMVIDDILLTAVGFAISLVADVPFLSPLLLIAYHTAMVGSSGQTLGKLALKVKVVRVDGSPVGFGGAFLRAVGLIVSTITAGLGYLVAFFTTNKRALHDFIGGTRVISLS